MSQPSLTSYPPSGRTLEFFVADDRRYLWVWLLRTMPCLRLSVINLQWSIYFQGLGEANRTYDGVPAATMLTSPVAAAVPGRPFVLAAVSAAWRLFSFMLAFNSRNWLSIPVDCWGTGYRGRTRTSHRPHISSDSCCASGHGKHVESRNSIHPVRTIALDLVHKAHVSYSLFWSTNSTCFTARGSILELIDQISDV